MPDQLDQPLPDSRLRWLRRTHPAHASRSDGFGRFAEATARFMGSPKFVLYMSIFVAVWIVANLILAKMQRAWDAYPFILLNLAFSTQASYSAPLIIWPRTGRTTVTGLPPSRTASAPSATWRTPSSSPGRSPPCAWP